MRKYIGVAVGLAGVFALATGGMLFVLDRKFDTTLSATTAGPGALAFALLIGGPIAVLVAAVLVTNGDRKP